ncbi:MAG TPA: TIGR04076 family protein [Streptosporangiaceae bacterium]|nr:TIGR04076 family protein [Streptosporangiaceae bacterium]
MITKGFSTVSGAKGFVIMKGPGMELYDLRVTVDSIGGRGVCGLRVGDYFEVSHSSQLRLPPGGHFCIYALAAVLPLLPAKQRDLPAADWLEQESLVACPDPDERLVMRISRTGRRALRSEDLTLRWPSSASRSRPTSLSGPTGRWRLPPKAMGSTW